MANSEKSKVKILLLYDYFIKKGNDSYEDSGATMAQITSYLEEKTETKFDRKSIRADIAKVNEFVHMTGMTDDEEWIYIEGQKYRRKELKTEFSMDEARLLVDAIRSTPFVETDLCDKIKQRYPSYFEGKRGNEYFVEHAKTDNYKGLLDVIRSCIDEQKSFEFNYGYKIGSPTHKSVSPIALDWTDSNYYLIAIDNNAPLVAGNKKMTFEDKFKSIRRYRIDRMERRGFSAGKKNAYVAFDTEEEKNSAIDRFIKASVSAFAGGDTEDVILTIISTHPDTEKRARNLAKAYTAFYDKIKVKTILSEKEGNEVKFVFEAGITPTLFTVLFELITFDDISIKFDKERNPDVVKKFEEYLRKGLSSIS